MVAAILVCYGAATPEQLAAGSAWYPTASAIAADIMPADPERAAAIVAVLSPRTTWKANVAAARIVASGGEPRAILGANVRKALLIRDGAPVADVLGGPKVRAFHAAIMGDADAVVVDAWAARVARRKAPGTERQYAAIARAYQRAARRLGVDARVVQAVTWIVARGSAD